MCKSLSIVECSKYTFNDDCSIRVFVILETIDLISSGKAFLSLSFKTSMYLMFTAKVAVWHCYVCNDFRSNTYALTCLTKCRALKVCQKI